MAAEDDQIWAGGLGSGCHGHRFAAVLQNPVKVWTLIGMALAVHAASDLQARQVVQQEEAEGGSLPQTVLSSAPCPTDTLERMILCTTLLKMYNWPNWLLM